MIDASEVAASLHVVRQIQALLERRFATRAEVRPTGRVPGEAASRGTASPSGREEGQLSAQILVGGEPRGIVALVPPEHADARDLDLLSDLVAVLAEEIGLALAERSDVIAVTTRYRYDELIGGSAPMRELQRLLDKVIGSDSTVLVQGENGTGKELIARAIHFNSPRATHRFVVQNCSAFNDNLLDSELFGHKKGAFTGAIADKEGLFELADKGTFFLDEIGDMSPSLQVKVLRVIQEGTFTAVGDTQGRHTDVRIIAATHRDLRQMVDEGSFREDLFYRVNVINVVVPPLRERREDIPVLIGHFLEKAARGGKKKRLTRGCLDRLMVHEWPGNVRELENEIERLVVLAGDARVIGEELLSSRIMLGVLEVGESKSLRDARADVEKELIADVLGRHRGNKTRAAEELGVSRRNLLRKVVRYGLEPPPTAPRRKARRRET